jgi:holo-[acyl-carrier protein] synthase
VIVAVGVDSVAIERIAGLLARGGERFTTRLFTPKESAYCASRGNAAAAAASFAVRFAAKEAVMKCLGTGWAEGIGFRQIEVWRGEAGDVRVLVHDAARQRAQALGIGRFHLSLTHTATTATAFVVAEA